MRIKSVGTDFMGLCPAAVQIDGSGNPTLLVNSLTFDTAPHFAQRFYLAHELGHWLLSTSSEEAADASPSACWPVPSVAASSSASKL